MADPILSESQHVTATLGSLIALIGLIWRVATQNAQAAARHEKAEDRLDRLEEAHEAHRIEDAKIMDEIRAWMAITSAQLNKLIGASEAGKSNPSRPPI